jgi:hypothetical protein
MDLEYCIVTKQTKDASSVLLDFLDKQTPSTIIGEFQHILTRIVLTDISIKTTNPDVLINYDHDGRDGHFYAEGIIKLSEYLAASLCQAQFCFHDVLGKHSELTFFMEDLETTYQDETSDPLGPDEYELDLDGMRFYKIKESVYEDLEKLLRKHMKTLEPIKPEVFKEGRYYELLDYGKILLAELLKDVIDE